MLKGLHKLLISLLDQWSVSRLRSLPDAQIIFWLAKPLQIRGKGRFTFSEGVQCRPRQEVKSIGLGNLVWKVIGLSVPVPDQERILDLTVLDRERRRPVRSPEAVAPTGWLWWGAVTAATDVREAICNTKTCLYSILGDPSGWLLVFIDIKTQYSRFPQKNCKVSVCIFLLFRRPAKIGGECNMWKLWTETL